MNVTDILAVTLLDLLYELRDADLPLILGGGYGLYLKHRQAHLGNTSLLLQAVPPLRSTNDLDLFLRTELLTDSARLRPLRAALDSLGFTVIASAQNYQFARKFAQGGQEWDIKVDLLANTSPWMLGIFAIPGIIKGAVPILRGIGAGTGDLILRLAMPLPIFIIPPYLRGDGDPTDA